MHATGTLITHKDFPDAIGNGPNIWKAVKLKILNLK